MALQAAFLFLIGDADETTRAVVSTPSIHLNVVGCKTYAEAEAAAKELAAVGVTAMEPVSYTHLTLPTNREV